MTKFELPGEHVLCSYCGHEAAEHREVGQILTLTYPEDYEGACLLNQREIVERDGNDG